eukprot:COSAG02_NODE_1463_length_12488_cov_7.312591_7_plen_43_part_00
MNVNSNDEDGAARRSKLKCHCQLIVNQLECVSEQACAKLNSQ